MEQTAEERKSPEKRPASRSVSPGTLVLVMVLAVAMGAVAYWFEDLKGWFSIQAWDTGAPRQTVASLIQVAHAKENARLADLLAPNVFTLKKNERGQVTSVDFVKYNGRTSQAPKDLVPPGAPKVMDVLLNKSGERNYFSVITQFANGKWGVFRVDRVKGKPMISELPPVLVDKRPENLKFY
jgi:hypothetical protein